MSEETWEPSVRARLDVEGMLQGVERDETLRVFGRVERVSGMIIEATLPRARVGATCRIDLEGGGSSRALLAEVVAVEQGGALMMPLGALRGVPAGARVELLSARSQIEVGPGCLGRVLNAMGEPIDGLGALGEGRPQALFARAPPALGRKPVEEALDLGVRAVNAALTLAHGQRVVIGAGAGVGKSTLLGMMARQAKVDVCVVALIGERGREVQEFVAEELGGAGASKHVVVVAATSDEPASMRLRAAHTATAIAEYFRDVRGERVLLLCDSLTRVAMAQREIGLSCGELPAERGYPPSTFALIPALLERAGMGARGAMTAIYTTLFDGGDELDPISDAARGTSDGHIILSRRMAERGIYPAIDINRSISRVMGRVTEPAHRALAQTMRAVLRDHEEARELVNLGAYTSGSNAAFDRALELGPVLLQVIAQAPEQRVDLASSVEALKQALLSAPRSATTPSGAREAISSAAPQKSAKAYASHA